MNTSENHTITEESSANLSIQIVVVIEKSTKLSLYRQALESVQCYAAIQGYSFRVAIDSMYADKCKQKDKFFRRHCVVVELMDDAEYTLFLDADIGVVNPKRRIEDYIDPLYDITFYDRFYNQEIMAGSYLVRNTQWARQFLRGFADGENHLPNSFHGTDNGYIHKYLVEVIFPRRRNEYSKCLRMYNQSKDFSDLFSYEACIRTIFGISEHFGPIRILRKGNGWARDNWLTNSKWSQEKDFMIHGWKDNQLVAYSKQDLPLGNDSWSHDINLVASQSEISERLAELFAEVEREKWISLARMAHII